MGYCVSLSIHWTADRAQMFALFLESLIAYVELVWRTFAERRSRPSLWGALTMAVFIPLFTLVQALHWLGFLFDEVLFRGYRQVPVRQPVFVLGPPRSGTTLVHRVLARDEQFTTLRTWECLFAPSVTQRRFYRALGRLDRWLGGYVGRGIHRVGRRVTGSLDTVHAMRLEAPEEDYLTLTPILACFILVLPFPFADRLWRLGLFDRDIPQVTRSRILAFYRKNLQRHLYVHGPEKRLLSKNASFGAWAGALRDTFPDASFLCCMRDPVETLPSQLSAVRGGVTLFDSARGDASSLSERFTEVLAFHYRNLLRVLVPMESERRTFLPMERLVLALEETIRDAYRTIQLPLSDAFKAVLHEEAAAHRGYRSPHGYDLADTGLDAKTMRLRFAPYYAWRETGTGASNANGAARAKREAYRGAHPSTVQVERP